MKLLSNILAPVCCHGCRGYPASSLFAALFVYLQLKREFSDFEREKKKKIAGNDGVLSLDSSG
jgi:hypothetical protein